MHTIGHTCRDRSSRAPKQLTLAAFLRDFVYAAAYLAILASIPATMDSVRGLAAAPSAQALIAGSMWLMIGLRYLRRRQVGALATHVVPVCLVVSFLGVTRDLDFNQNVGVILLTCTAATIFSYPISLAKRVESVIDRESQPIAYLGYNVLGAAVAMAFVCLALPSLLRNRFYWEGAMFGALLGSWFGLYQAVATSRRLGRMTFAGLSIKAAVIAGFWAGTLVPLVFFPVAVGLAGWNSIPARFSPLIGVPAAIIAGRVCRSNAGGQPS